MIDTSRILRRRKEAGNREAALTYVNETPGLVPLHIVLTFITASHH